MFIESVGDLKKFETNLINKRFKLNTCTTILMLISLFPITISFVLFTTVASEDKVKSSVLKNVVAHLVSAFKMMYVSVIAWNVYLCYIHITNIRKK